MKKALKWLIVTEAVLLCVIMSILVVSGEPVRQEAAVQPEETIQAGSPAQLAEPEQTGTPIQSMQDKEPAQPEEQVQFTESQLPAQDGDSVQSTESARGGDQAQDDMDEAAADASLLLPVFSNGVLDTADMFTDRDLAQSVSVEDAIAYTAEDGSDIHITQEGTYVLSGSAQNCTIYVEAADDAKVQLVLDGLSVSNADFPCIYVISGDKVFVTTTGDSTLEVTGTFRADGETNTDSVIFSRSDLVLNGTAVLTISSSDNAVVSKDDLKITGGTYHITAASKTLEANDSIRIAGGTLNLEAGTDALHAENDEDDSLGYVYICGGTLNIQAGDDGIHGTSAVQIDEGTISISAAEGIEGTCIQINSGKIDIYSWDDGINASNKSSAYVTGLEINGGEISVSMAAGDTDGIDSNGNLTINGGTISVEGNSAFDCDGVVSFNAGTVIVNGQQVYEIPNQAMGGARGGSRGGGRR